MNQQIDTVDYILDFENSEIAPGAGFCVVAKKLTVDLFRADEVIIQESLVGSTRIIAAFVGQKMQLPLADGKGRRSIDVDPFTLLDTCQKDLCITFWVANDASQTVTWHCKLKGKAIL